MLMSEMKEYLKNLKNVISDLRNLLLPDMDLGSRFGPFDMSGSFLFQMFMATVYSPLANKILKLI